MPFRAFSFPLMLPVLLSRSTSDDPIRWRWRDLPLRVKGIIVIVAAILYRRGAYVSRPPGNPALVLLDLEMPKVSRLEVLKQIKGDAALQTVPAVMLTSSREEGDLLSSYRLGVNAYVVKAVDFGDFMEAVRQLGGFRALINKALAAEVEKLVNARANPSGDHDD